MGREILFRGRKTGFDEWVVGYISSDEEDGIYEMVEEHTKIKWYVDAETVCQFTGLLDESGTKIFEGDILEYISLDDCSHHCLTVVWDRGTFTVEEEGVCVGDPLWTFLCLGVSVVGNIFDHDELVPPEEHRRNEMDEPNAHYYENPEQHEAFADCFTIAKHLYEQGCRKFSYKRNVLYNQWW